MWINLEDFNDFQERVPHYRLETRETCFPRPLQCRGVPAVMKYLLKNGFLYGIDVSHVPVNGG